MSDLALTYAADWFVAEQTDSSISFTPRDARGDAVLTVQWLPTQGTTATLATAFFEQLELTASEVEQLPDIRVGSIRAKRYASVIGSGSDQKIVLHVIFVARSNAYLATFSASPDTFADYVARAEQLIVELQPR